MPYRPIDAQTRLTIIKQYWAGHKISELERRFNVDRDSIHIWINKAETALQEVLTPKKPGPKKDELNKLITRNAELESLNQQLQIQLGQLSQESQFTLGITRNKAELRPSACPSCGCDVIWKNGSYTTVQGSTQRFRCRSCGTKIFMEVKKTP